MVIFNSCNSETKQQRVNPLLAEEWETPFGIVPFEQIRAEHYLEAFESAFEQQRAEVDSIALGSDESFEGVILALDHSGLRVKELRDLFEMSEAAISDESYRAVSAQIMPKLAAADDAVWMNEALYSKVQRIYSRRSELGLDRKQERLLEKFNTRFVRGGAKLDAEQKRALAAINEELARLTSKFTQNLLAENDKNYLLLNARELEGMTNDMRIEAKREAESRGYKDGWVITLNPSMMIPFLTKSQERGKREEIFKAYISRGANGGESDNSEIVRRVTELRQERAQMLGYNNHAEYVISQQMAKTPQAAYELLDKIWEPALKNAKSELEALQKLLEVDDKSATIEPWDWYFYTEKVRNNRYKFTNESIAPYLSEEVVRGGAFTLANRLYGVTFRPVTVPIYDEDCVAFEVLDSDHTHLGVLYFDLYPRSGKGQGAWCGNLREQRRDEGDRITPVVAIVCNFPRPTQNTPSLLSLEQVETLFHEFGHALHFIFQDVDYRGLAAVEGDFVEFPSQVMENWALSPELLRMYAVHHRTGQPMPASMIKNIEKSREFNQGFETISVAAAALLDLDLQTTTDLTDFDIESFEQRSLNEKRGLISAISPRYHLTNFAHLFTYDYSAGYYFYLWSEVLDKDCYAAFRESGDLFSRPLATKLRREILERGGEADGNTLYKNFRGKAPSQQGFLRARGLD
ncbi:MAG: M3 family metallopeptidase [Rikenellaceae bacterium]